MIFESFDSTSPEEGPQGQLCFLGEKFRAELGPSFLSPLLVHLWGKAELHLAYDFYNTLGFSFSEPKKFDSLQENTEILQSHMQIKARIQKSLNHSNRFPCLFWFPQVSLKWIILPRSNEMNEFLQADSNRRQKISLVKPFTDCF